MKNLNFSYIFVQLLNFDKKNFKNTTVDIIIETFYNILHV